MWQDGAVTHTIHISLRIWVRLPLGTKSYQSIQLRWVPGKVQTNMCVCEGAYMACQITEGPTWVEQEYELKKHPIVLACVIVWYYIDKYINVDNVAQMQC